MRPEPIHSAELSPQDWAALKSRFLDIADGADTPADDDSGLLRELLHADQVAGRFLGALDDADDPPALDFAASLDPGQIFADCRVLRLAGRGGMSEVYEAEDLGLAVGRDDQPGAPRRVALKLLPGSMADHRRHAALRRDADALSRLAHPGVARVYRGGVAPLPGGEPRPFLALEYIDGPTIDRFVRDQVDRGAKRDRLALSLGLQLADALACCHRSGVVHRDLKASNILVRADASIAILDFGIARLIDDAQRAAPSSTVTMQLEGVGSITSISPERARGADSGPREDVWAIGALLFEFAAGRPPHDLTGLPSFEAVQHIARVPPPRLAHAAPRFPRDLATVIDRCLAFDPADRYADANELLAELLRVRDGLAPRARAIGPAGRLWRWAKRHRAIAASLAVILAILTASSISLALLAAHAASARQLAEERRASSEAVANGLLFDVSKALDGLPGAAKAQERLLEIGLNYAESALAREGELDGATRLQLARALFELGWIRYIQGVAGADAEHAALAFERAHDIALGVADEMPADSMAQAEALGVAAWGATARCSMAMIIADPASIEPLALEAQRLAQRALAIDPDQREAILGLYEINIDLTDDARTPGDWVRGLEACHDAVAMTERLRDRLPNDREVLAGVVIAWSALAQRQYWARQAGNEVDSLHAARAAVAAADALAAIDPRGFVAIKPWTGRVILARAVADESPHPAPESPDLLRLALGKLEELSARDPADARIRRDLWAAYGIAGEAYEFLAARAPTPADRRQWLAEAAASYQNCLDLHNLRAARGEAQPSEAADIAHLIAHIPLLRAELAAPPAR